MGVGRESRRSSLATSALAGLVALLVGLAVRLVTGWFRDHGPSWDGISLAGNGAIVFLLLAPVALVVGMVWCARRRDWLGMALVPVGLFVGLTVVAGPV
jgi:hypothetical protein